MKRVSVIHALLITLFVILEVEVTGNRAFAEDWPVFGRDASRNAVVVTGNAPTDWDVDNGRNIRWKVQLGSATFATPVVAGGRVYIGTNNGAGYLERYPATIQLAVIAL